VTLCHQSLFAALGHLDKPCLSTAGLPATFLFPHEFSTQSGGKSCYSAWHITQHPWWSFASFYSWAISELKTLMSVIPKAVATASLHHLHKVKPKMIPPCVAQTQVLDPQKPCLVKIGAHN
jgi:hypothetical protein